MTRKSISATQLAAVRQRLGQLDKYHREGGSDPGRAHTPEQLAAEAIYYNKASEYSCGYVFRYRLISVTDAEIRRTLRRDD